MRRKAKIIVVRVRCLVTNVVHKLHLHFGEKLLHVLYFVVLAAEGNYWYAKVGLAAGFVVVVCAIAKDE